MLAEVAAAGPADVDAAVAAARRAYARLGSMLARPSAASTSSASPGILQERARELAVLESIDNGKPIKETRDVDCPLVAAHFFYYARAGPTSWPTPASGPTRSRSASPVRSSRGTSRC